MQSPEVWSDKSLASKLGTEIKELKDVLESNDAEKIKDKTNALTQASLKLGEAMYKAQQASADATNGAETASAQTDDTVVDADFEEVKK